jgi:hypothetical protein
MARAGKKRTGAPAAAAASPEVAAVCAWAETHERGTWAAKCGKLFILNTGAPIANGMLFCCFCGRKVQERPSTS